MKKYFSSGFFFNINSKHIAFQRTQPELLEVSERDAAYETIHRPPPEPEGQITVFIYIMAIHLRSATTYKTVLFRVCGGEKKL